MLPRTFYERPTLDVAPELIGKVLTIIHDDGTHLKGRIVEVEAYIGPNDQASHTYGGKQTVRNQSMFKQGGTAYVYIIYGLHHCMNVVTRGAGKPEGVLIRAVEPLEGIESMSKQRYGKPIEDLTRRERLNLTNGPGKFGQAFGISRDEMDGHDFCSSTLFLEDGERGTVLRSKRIGIPNSGEAKEYLWRFYEANNPYVSKHPNETE
ncbi:DNA-3-methyladenine glycosylase [Geomicrobium sp. JCM 19038]|uniref:DNA-3-methyladenine glycosylase n=1 Tax=Geomicrobium sp. JCM 19038 TaxID=1460635 RepID=UPI00045F44B1|nr:DNA-3-methyladenine glycosylase [Geomicrobium sp. JCM 19038]GAK09085.1 DNA-3-methyladenine glycosylase II [Geomicrobium sp. JCM 19038]